MPIIACPFPDCTYNTIDANDDLAATLLQIHASGAHAPPGAPPRNNNSAKVCKVSRPTLSIGGTSEEWSYFKIRWDDYKQATSIKDREVVIQLLECCDEDLRKDLTRYAGGSLTGLPESDVLASIQKLAVREENTMVARVALSELRQDRDEPIRSFAARVRGKASICKYMLKCQDCDADVIYTDHIIRDIIIQGVSDSDIQLDLLSETNQDMLLEQVIVYIEKKESGKRSANKLLTSQGAEAVRHSQYRKQKQYPPSQTEKAASCNYCGQPGHGKNSPSLIRKSQCTAYNKTCGYCQKLNHLQTVCRSKQKGNFNREESISSSLCTITLDHHLYDSSSCAITLDHHLYDSLARQWSKRASKPQPFVSLDASIDTDAYQKLCITIPSHTTPATLHAMADTGCQSCLTGIDNIHRLNMTEDDLIPVKMKMHAANNHRIPLLGATILTLTGTAADGTTHVTHQIVYVTKDSCKFFLSQEACMELGLIAENFPSFPTHSEKSINDVNEINHHLPSDSALSKPCSCPSRQLPPPKPTELPFPATTANRNKLKQWLLDYYHASSFNTCTHQPLTMMDTKPLHLMIDPEAKPVAYHTPVPVPIHWQDDVKAGLDQDTRLGVIEPVPIGEPVTWCHRMVVCAKKTGKPRRTVDFQALNVHATRETHHTQSPFHQVRSIPHMKKKTVFDCWNGYHSIPLHNDDRHLTTFITPWGRYRYKAAPQGYISSGDGYSRRFDEIVSDFPNFTKCIDDALLWEDDVGKSFFQAVDWLDLCGQNGITLNPEKFQFSEDVAEFAGFEITLNTVRPCKKYLAAIRNFPNPSNITDIRSWFGLINQVSYAFASAPQMQCFRELLKPNVPFNWDHSLEEAFKQSKDVIIKEIEQGVEIFDKTKPTCLATDWAKSGIGFWIMQKHCYCDSSTLFCCHDGWKTTLVGSRFTHGAESRYAPIEGEALAVVDALDKARHFVLGCNDLTIAVDHKPLLKIFGDRTLNEITNTRLRNLKEKSLRYRFKIIHIPGIKNKVPDALSRHPVNSPNDVELHLPDDVATCSEDYPNNSSGISYLLSGIRTIENKSPDDIDRSIISAISTALMSIEAVTWDKIRLASSSNPEIIQLNELIESGFPDKLQDVPPGLQDYHQYREHLSTSDGVVIYKERIVVPECLRTSILQSLHSAHQGVSTMIARAKSSVFWPGITPQIQQLRARCTDCNRNAPSQPSAPPYPPVLPEYPFQCIAADYFHYKGQTYLIAVDRYSNWPIIERANAGSKGLVNDLRKLFATYGIPDELSSDGGPEFAATLTSNFLKSWGVHHRVSSVAYPHSNCRAELGVKQAKRLISSNTGHNGDLNTDLLQRAMLQYRNNPNPETGISPAECIFGRPVKDFIPILPGKYQPHHTWRDTLANREKALRCRHHRAAERWTEHTRRLTPLKVGDHVYVQNQTGNHPLKWDTTGQVTEVRQYDQYLVRVDGSGRVTLRNRKFLRKFIPVQPPTRHRLISEDLRFLPNPTPDPGTQRGNTPISLATGQSSANRPQLDVTPTPAIASSAPSPLNTVIPNIHRSKPKVPLALRRLLDHNSKGFKET